MTAAVLPARAPFFSLQNVPLWMGLFLAAVFAGLAYWTPTA